MLCSETNIQAFSQESPASVSASSISAASPGSRLSTSVLPSGSAALPERLSRASSFSSAAFSKSRSRRSGSLSQMLSQKIKSKEIASNGSVLSYMLSDLYGHRFFDDIDIEQQTAPLLSLHPEPVCNPIRVIIKPMQLSFKFFRENCDIFYFRMAIYDFERRLKVSEDFTYMISQPGAESQHDHLADMAAWTKMNSINEGAHDTQIRWSPGKPWRHRSACHVLHLDAPGVVGNFAVLRMCHKLRFGSSNMYSF